MFSPHLCICGCTMNVEQAGTFYPGHEDVLVANAFKEHKNKTIERNQAAARQRIPMAPNFGRGVGHKAFPAEPMPVKAPFFGRKDNAK